MSDPTPILRADATDDDLQHEDAPEWGTEADGRVIPASETFAEGGTVEGSEDGTDALPEILSYGCEMECYENSEGGWSYRPVVR